MDTYKFLLPHLSPSEKVEHLECYEALTDRQQDWFKSILATSICGNSDDVPNRVIVFITTGYKLKDGLQFLIDESKKPDLRYQQIVDIVMIFILRLIRSCDSLRGALYNNGINVGLLNKANEYTRFQKLNYFAGLLNACGNPTSPCDRFFKANVILAIHKEEMTVHKIVKASTINLCGAPKGESKSVTEDNSMLEFIQDVIFNQELSVLVTNLSADSFRDGVLRYFPKMFSETTDRQIKAVVAYYFACRNSNLAWKQTGIELFHDDSFRFAIEGLRRIYTDGQSIGLKFAVRKAISEVNTPERTQKEKQLLDYMSSIIPRSGRITVQRISVKRKTEDEK